MNSPADKPHIAFWSPLPPQPSGISDYSAELLEYLVRYCRVELFADELVKLTPTLNTQLTINPAQQYEHRQQQDPFAANIYHMGNHTALHAQIYEQLLHHPGLVVLHDPYLGSFYRGLFRDRPEAFLDEVEYNYGLDTRLKLAERWSRGDIDDDFEFGLERRVVEASLGVIVHSVWTRNYLSARYPHKPILHIPMGAARPAGTVEHVREQHGWGPEQLVIGAFSGMQPIKRLHVLVEAFRRFHARFPKARLILAGREDHMPYVQQLWSSIKAANLEPVVHFAGSLPLDDLVSYMQASDLIVNLRWPTAGETSASMMRALGAGKVVITSDAPQFRELPEAFCWRISVDESQEIVQLVERFAYAANHLAETRAAGKLAGDYIEQYAHWDRVAQLYATAVQQCPAWAAGALTTPPARPSGVNLIGDLRLDAGLGEAAQKLLKSIQQQHIPVSLREMTYWMGTRTNGPAPTGYSAIPRGSLYPINLLTFNFHEVVVVPPEQMRELLAGKYTIANWFWEFPKIPEHLMGPFTYADELWVASHHIQASMQPVARGPVKVIPVPVEVTTSPHPDRQQFGLPDNRFIFLFSFSATSCHARKNPFGLIEAFEKAFGRAGVNGPLLVIRAHQLGLYSELQAALHEAMGRVGGIILEEPYSRQAMNDLLACADAYVSLHRAEGFGLGIAESMYLGKPVIATHYSGNADFMTGANSYPVGYTLRPVTAEDHQYQPDCSNTYQPGQLWAEPDMEQAVNLLRHVFEKQEDARAIGQQAARDIRRYCSPAVVGHMIEKRLIEIETTLAPTAFFSAPASTNNNMPLSDPFHNLLTFYRDAWRDWLAVYQQFESAPLNGNALAARLAQLPGAKSLLLLAQRLRRLGYLTSKQMVVNSAAHETAEALARTLAVDKALIGTLRETVSQIPEQTQLQLQPVNADITELQSTLEQVLIREQDSQAAIEELNEQVRLLTSQLRFMEMHRVQKPALARSEINRAQLEVLVRRLEDDFPALVKANNVSFSVQAVASEDLIMWASEYFGERLNARQWQSLSFHNSSAWYHVDFTADWNRPALFENAASKLIPGGVLVLVTAANAAGQLPASPAPGLSLTRDETADLPSAMRVRVLVWQRD